MAPQNYWEYGHAVADFGKQTTFWNTNARGIRLFLRLNNFFDQKNI